MTVGELLERMDSMEMTLWLAFDEIQAKEAKRAQSMADQGMQPRGFAGGLIKRRGKRR